MDDLNPLHIMYSDEFHRIIDTAIAHRQGAGHAGVTGRDNVRLRRETTGFLGQGAWGGNLT